MTKPRRPRRRYKVVIEYWTNVQAKEALAKAPAGQRDVDPIVVRMFRRLWDEDRWDPTIGAPICWMEDGTMGNGHHRATFIAGLPDGIEVPVLVAYDVPMAMLPYMDGGKNRTLGHHLRYAFPDESQEVCRNAASIAPIIMGYTGPGKV